MGAKNLVDNVDDLLPSKSEWMGFYSKNGKTHTLLPKSLQSGNPKDLAKVVNALFFIQQIDLDPKANRNVKFVSGEVDVESNLSKVICYYLFEILKDVHDEVLKTNFFNYQRTSENLSKIRGRINFGKSVSKNMGLLHKNYCEFNDINFDHPVLYFIRFSFKYFMQQLSELGEFKEEVLDELAIMSSAVDHALSDCKSSMDVTRIAMDIISGKYDREFLIQKILPGCKILANTYLDNTLFFSDEKSSQKLPNGIVINLNRAFETVLRNSVEIFLKDTFSERDYKILHKNVDSFTKYFKDGGTYFQMKPDCWFDLKGVPVILDAKHKISSREASENQIDFEKIDRNDLYQITAYAQNHPNRNPGVYGILSLHEESRFSEFDDYISGVTKVQILDKTINLVSMRFVKFLYDVGDAISDTTHINEFGLNQNHAAFAKLGSDIFEELGLLAV
jgi:5-methylcytosine-specific restriction endonuclease McrBC regulatory subunit McrC